MFSMKTSPSLTCLVVLTIALLVDIHQAYQPPLNQPAGLNKTVQCYFERNACHFRNQHNLAKFKRYDNSVKPLYGHKTALVLNLSDQRVHRYPGSRLITHYFPVQYSNVCLFITYQMAVTGGRSALYVIKQDKENECLFSDHNPYSKPSNVWQSIQLQINVQDGPPRFFIQTDHDRSTKGLILIGEFSYSYGYCQRDDTNHCEDPLVNKEDDLPNEAEYNGPSPPGAV